MARKIDTDANINRVRFSQQTSHPSSPSSGYEYLYTVSGSAYGGLYLKDPAGREIGPFITGTTPRLELDYVEFTSNVNPTATTEGTANTVVTGNAVVYDGSTAVIIEFFSQNSRPDTGAAGRELHLWLYQDGSSIGRVGLMSVPDVTGGNGMNIPIHVFRRLTPSAGSHTYSIRASVTAGTGLVAGGAGGAGNSAPGFIRIVRASP